MSAQFGIATFIAALLSIIVARIDSQWRLMKRGSIYPAVFVVGLSAMALILLSFFIWPPGTL